MCVKKEEGGGQKAACLPLGRLNTLEKPEGKMGQHCNNIFIREFFPLNSAPLSFPINFIEYLRGII